MRTIVRATLTWLLCGGCKEYFTIDEACKDKVPGENLVSDAGAVESLHRANCYRRLVGVRKARFQRQIQEAADNHANYMSLNEVWLPESGYLLGLEDPSKPGFTGETVFDRLAHVDYALQDLGGLQYQELIFFQDDLTGAERVDGTFTNPYFREYFLQLSTKGVGFAETGTADGLRTAYYLIVHSYPTTERGGKPVVYPKDGQLDVPTHYYDFDVRTELPDSFYELVPVGFPITVMVGSIDGTSSDLLNPYNLKLTDVSLKGPEGKLDVYIVTPPQDPTVSMTATAMVAATEPLEPATTYTFKARAQWSSTGDRDIEVAFTTSKEAGTFFGLTETLVRRPPDGAPQRVITDLTPEGTLIRR